MNKLEAMSKQHSKRICLFGGTFDPIHNAHLQIATEALDRCGLDHILFIPAGRPPHKASVSMAGFEDRFRMAELACAGQPRFEPSRLEEGQEQSYTVETLTRLRHGMQKDEQLSFLIGADAFAEIETWHRWREVIALTDFVVVARPGVRYVIPPGAHVHPLEGLALPVASSTIRARIAAGESTPELPQAVREYIDSHGLYKANEVSAITA